jgi:hypothetical protein
VTGSDNVRHDKKYLDFHTNTIQLDELRKRFEVYTGPVKNTDGVL